MHWYQKREETDTKEEEKKKNIYILVHLSYDMCHVLGVRCQVSGVTCCVLHVNCLLSLTPIATVKDPPPGNSPIMQRPQNRKIFWYNKNPEMGRSVPMLAICLATRSFHCAEKRVFHNGTHTQTDFLQTSWLWDWNGPVD